MKQDVYEMQQVINALSSQINDRLNEMVETKRLLPIQQQTLTKKDGTTFAVDQLV